MRKTLAHPLIFLMVGFGLWLLALVLLYAIQSTGCAYGGGRSGFFSPLRLLLVSVWVAHTFMIFLLYRYCQRAQRAQIVARPDATFLWRSSAALAAAAILAAAWIGMVLALPTLCA